MGKGNGTSSAIRSMTGYASHRASTPEGELNVSLRSVNGRGLDLHMHLCAEAAPFENEIRAALKRELRRGNVEARATLSRSDTGRGTAIDRQLLGRYVADFSEVCTQLGLDSKPDLNVLLQLPGMLSERILDESSTDEFGRRVTEAFARCARILSEVREREGNALAAEVDRLGRGITDAIAEIGQIRERAIPEFHKRLKGRIEELLGSSGISDTRLAEEAALLADRSDIQEEVTRLSVHSNELRHILREGGEVGKRLDFLLQELNREINTTLAKSGNAGAAGLQITDLGLKIKADIEKIREQALNLE